MRIPREMPRHLQPVPLKIERGCQNEIYSQETMWEKERIHDLEQPTIKAKLLAALQADPTRPTTAILVQDIAFWCGITTVAKWRKTLEPKPFQRTNTKKNPPSTTVPRKRPKPTSQDQCDEAYPSKLRHPMPMRPQLDRSNICRPIRYVPSATCYGTVLSKG
jgi:hypothetical protein